MSPRPGLGLGALPRDLRQLLAFVPTHGWDALPWRPLLRELRGITLQLATGRGVAGLAATVDGLTDAVAVTDALSGDDIEALGPRQRKAAGDALLRFYFAQWRSESGLFVDLRPTRCRWHREALQFSPSGLHTQLDDGFRRGMIDLYLGFYLPDVARLDDALYRLGFLHPDLDDDSADELRSLLKQHFGASTTAQAFSIDAFRESFDALFEFFIEHDYQLPADFVLVGFYLITLYLSLDALGTRHDVQALCLEELSSEIAR